MKTKKLNVYEEEHDFLTDYQSVKDEVGVELFSVYNLSDCPEDAIIDRDLFNAYNYVNAVRYGMELARQGYEDIEVSVTKRSED